MDSADEIESPVQNDDAESSEEVTETVELGDDTEEEQEPTEVATETIDDEEPDTVEPEVLVEAVLPSDTDDEVEVTDVEGSAAKTSDTTAVQEVQSDHHAEGEETQDGQRDTAEEQSAQNSGIACDELFEEIEPNQDTESDDELIGIDREDHNDSFVENYCGEVEIKEEEMEIEADAYQSLVEDDPIMDMPAPIKDECSEDNLDDTTVQVRQNTRQRGKKKQSSSETDTADEGEDCAIVTNPVGEHAYHASPVARHKMQLRKKKVVKKKPFPPAPSPFMPRNVRNFVHTKHSTYTCLECNGQFFSIVQYLKHRKRHPKEVNFPYQCRYCTSRFRQHKDMLPHLLTHSKLEKLSCPMCPTQVFSAHKLVSHMQVHRNPKENYYFKCVTCSVRFSKCKQLEDHNLMSHPKYINGVPVQPAAKTGFEPRNATRTVHVCFHCGKVESTWPELLMHMRIHKGPLACTICRLSLKTSDAFAEHVVKVHKDMGELTYLQCKNPTCPREFIATRELKQHEATCLPLGGEYRCEICDQLYREVDHFVTHMELHSMLSNELGHKMCPDCVFPATDPSSYAAHLVNHHGYRDRVETLEKAYALYMNQDARDDTSSADSDDDDDSPDEAVQVCE